ncbi:MAG: hypothetical protein AAF639_00460 [Chloroflexota bacterium]
MIVFIDIEHERVQQHPDKWEEHLARRLKTKYRLEEISGDHCLLLRYERANPNVLREVNARAVLVSGNMTEFQHYSEEDLAGLRAIFREPAQPTIGFCGGFQMMAETHGVEASAIVADEQGNMDDDSWKARTSEWGFTPIRKTASHPLLAGLDDDMYFFEAHYWEIKGCPAGFDVFAETDITPIQLMAHQKLPLFGTQFHPEAYDEAHLDGRRLLENFFKLI